MIKLSKINKSFPRPNQTNLKVLKNINLEISKGEFTAVVGSSGSGKTTMMNILGLLDRPDSGEYFLNGDLVSSQSAKQLAQIRNKTIGFVFQQFHLLARTTACENVELPLLYSREKHSQEKAIKALCKVGLEERIMHYPNELSGGQQQRVAIARAIVNEPTIIFADEPTGNLDELSAERVMKIFQDLNQAGTTIVFITHDKKLAEKSNRIIQINDGVIHNKSQHGE